MNQYFDDNRQLPQNRKDISFRFSGFQYSFMTDNGVFCKDEVDFGTRVLLGVVENYKMGHTVLDMGCGYGPIGIALKKMNPESKVIMAEVNPRAAELAVLNAQKNGVETEVRISDCFENITETLSDIVTNPPIRAGKAVIYRMFEEGYDHLEAGGHLFAVIRKQQGALSAQKKLSELFGQCEVLKREKGYFILYSTKSI